MDVRLELFTIYIYCVFVFVFMDWQDARDCGRKVNTSDYEVTD